MTSLSRPRVLGCGAPGAGTGRRVTDRRVRDRRVTDRRGDVGAAGAALFVGAVAALADVPIARAVLTDADRGLDAMDESHYLMAAQPWAADKAFNGVFGWYSGLLLRLVGSDLSRLRVLAALLLVVTALVLAGAVRRAAEVSAGRRWPLWVRALWPPGVVAAAFCYYTVFVRTPSYNWFAALGLMLLAAGLLRVLTLDGAPTARPLLRRPAVLAGVLVALGAFLTAIGKATTALGAAVVVALAVGLHVVGLLGQRDRRGPLRSVGVAALAAVATAPVLLFVHVVATNSLGFTIATYRRVSGMLSAVDPYHYAPGRLLPTARAGLRNVLLDRPHHYLVWLLVPAAMALLLLVVAAVRRPLPNGGWLLVAAHAVPWWLTLLTVVQTYPGGVPGLGMSASPLVVAAEASAVVAAGVWLTGLAVRGSPAPGRRQAALAHQDPGTGEPAHRRPGTAAIGCLALLALGAGYPLGTNVEYATQLHGGFPVLLAAAVIGLSALPDGAAVGAVASLAAGAVLLGGVLVPTTRDVAPYRIALLDQQTQPREIVAGTPPVLVDPPTAAWIDGLRSLARAGGLAPAGPVLDLTWHPAAVLVLGGHAPTVLLPAFPGWPDPVGSAAYALRQEDRTIWRQAWLLVPSGQADGLTDRAVAVVGRRFPADYDLLGTVIAPYDGQVQGLWRPR